jgi:3-aminobutyryl-CoA ammonia-lyase
MESKLALDPRVVAEARRLAALAAEPHAHYGGSLVDGAYVLGMFGDVATELCIRTDGDEGLFAGYGSVAFEAPVRAGDVLEATAELIRVGTRSREVEFTAQVVCRAAPERSASAADVLAAPVVVVRARGTVVIP